MAGKPNASAITLFAHPRIELMPANENLVFEDCLFEGPTNAALLIDGSVRNVVFRHNRIFNATFGLLLKQPKDGQWYEFQFQGNTLANITQSALHFEGPPLPDSSGTMRSQVVIAQNLFVNCKDVCTTLSGALPAGASFKANARNKQCGEGNCKMGAVEVDFNFANANDANSSDFLRYTRSSTLASMPDGPIGVPPRD
jgi:hypothetical protein